MTARLPWLDAARGAALLAMAAFHFTWDLANFHWIDAEIVDARAFHWLGHAIAGSFLFLVGYSLVLAREARGHPLWRDRRYWLRLAQIVAAALAITVVSFKMFPEAPIFFGILHCIALSSVIALAFVESPLVVVVGAAALALAAPLLFVSQVFDAKALLWIGLSTFHPASNDYRPLLPWLGIVLLGVAAARARSLALAPVSNAPAAPSPLQGGKKAPVRGLAFLGRHSLAFYLLHQPILFGGLALIGPAAAPASDEAAFVGQCVTQCAASGASVAICEASCACVVSRARAAGRWTALVTGKLSDDEKRATHDDLVSCHADALGG